MQVEAAESDAGVWILGKKMSFRLRELLPRPALGGGEGRGSPLKPGIWNSNLEPPKFKDPKFTAQEDVRVRDSCDFCPRVGEAELPRVLVS